jgi:hypothetical protein
VQLVVQLRSVFAEYGLSGTNIDGRHCDTVMPSTTTARRVNTRIEAHTYRVRISPPGLKEPHRSAFGQPRIARRPASVMRIRSILKVPPSTLSVSVTTVASPASTSIASIS